MGGTVRTEGGALNIRSYPSFDSYVIATAPNGAAITVLGQYQDWYTVMYGDAIGYANVQYIEVY